jgi:hypothetical protein
MHQRSFALDGLPQRLANNGEELRIIHRFLKKSLGPGFEPEDIPDVKTCLCTSNQPPVERRGTRQKRERA